MPDFNVVITPPTCPNPTDARKVAQFLRDHYDGQRAFPKTQEEYFSPRFEPRLITAFNMCGMIHAQAGGTYEEAQDACEEIFPELFADYWEKVMGF